jgi:hypothetical protein
LFLLAIVTKLETAAKKMPEIGQTIQEIAQASPRKLQVK